MYNCDYRLREVSMKCSLVLIPHMFLGVTHHTSHCLALAVVSPQSSPKTRLVRPNGSSKYGAYLEILQNMLEMKAAFGSVYQR